MNEYTGEQLHEQFLQAPPEVQKILLSDDLDTTSTVLGKLYKLPIDKYVVLKNIITLVLLGIIKPEGVVGEIEKQISLGNTEASSLAKDLDDSILQEARIKLFGESEDIVEVKTLPVKNSSESSTELLREEIMSRTKPESAINKAPSEILTMPTRERLLVSPVAGSHDQLIEQLTVLQNVPKDDEVEARLAKIRTQVEDIQKNTYAEMEKEEEVEKAEYVALATTRKPVFPDHYEADPYREMAMG